MDEDGGGLRTALTPLLVVVGVAIGAFLVVALVALGVGTLWGVLFGGGLGGEAVPLASFDATPTDGAIEVTHVEGDPVDPAALELSVGEDPVGSWAELGGETSGDGVAVGDSLELSDAESGDRLVVTWIDGEDRRTLHNAPI